MNKVLSLFASLTFLALPCTAADNGPKPPSTRQYRIILYVPHSTQPYEYTDVAKIIKSDPAHIIFETSDGFVIIHNGSYTSIQPKDTFR
jgi:hypothetical protein